MASKAGQIVINIRAGTNNLTSDLDKGKAAFKDFGAHGVSSIQATSASLRLLEGNMTNNLRASERFIANVLKLGPALQFAFPLVGGLAFLGLLGELGGKLVNFFKEVQKAPQATKDAFDKLNDGLAVTNADLAVTNARLEQDIAKLEGKPTNNLKIALAEAQAEAAKLERTLQGALEQSNKLLQQQTGGFMHRLGSGLLGNADTQDIVDETKRFQERTAHLSGSALVDAYKAEIAKFSSAIKSVADTQQSESIYGAQGFNPGEVVVGDYAKRVEMLLGQKKQYLELLKNISEEEKKSGLETKKSADEAKRESENLTKPITDKLKQLQVELEASKEKLAAIGDVAAQTTAAGMAKAASDIAEVNKQLEKRGPADQMDALTALQIIFTDATIAANNADRVWQQKLDEVTKSIKDRAAAQEKLNAAIGGTYAQQRSARVEGAVSSAVGAENYNAYSGQLGGVRSAAAAADDATETGRSKNTLQQLSERIRLTQAGAAAERDGAYAVKQAELSERLKIAIQKEDINQTREVIKEIELEEAARDQAVQKELHNISMEASARGALGGAGGEGARLKVEAQNAYNAALDKTRSTLLAEAAYADVYAKNYDKIRENANSRVYAEGDNLKNLQRELSVIDQMKVTDENRLQISTARRDLENQILQAQAGQLERQDSALAGLRAGLDRIASSAQTIAKTISDAMVRLTDGTTNALANMLTGKKPKGGYGQEFGKLAQGVGHDLIQGTMKSGISAALKHFGINGKADGSRDNPFWVKSSDLGGLPSAGSGGSSTPGTIFGGSAGGGIFNFANQLMQAMPHFADGVSDFSGGLALVGENGPEIRNLPAGTNITPMGKAGGGSDVHYHYTINAPGAEIGAENRIAMAVKAAHDEAVKNSIRAQHDQRRRTPQKSGK